MDDGIVPSRRMHHTRRKRSGSGFSATEHYMCVRAKRRRSRSISSSDQIRPNVARQFVSVLHLLAAFLLTPNMVDFLCLRGWSNSSGGGNMLATIADAAVCTAVVQEPFEVSASSIENVSLSSIFDCEDGVFEVTWSGVVNVTDSIRIGNRTTVSITGDYVSNLAVKSTDGVSTTSGTDAITTSDTVGSSAAIASNKFGPIFIVEGGQLNLTGIAVRDGNARISTGDTLYSGGGVNAKDATVTVIGCEFEDNFAAYWGGGIFANRSTVTVRDTAFRECNAGLAPTPGDDADDVEGSGGGIGVYLTDLFVDNCLFENCFASKKGGGVHPAQGKFSMLNSIFVDNTAGGENVDSEDAIGEGADLTVTGCEFGFDDVGACGVNDTTFLNGFVARKGGSVQVSAGMSGTSYVEIHRCTFSNVTAGIKIDDDPQGEGGAFSVGAGSTLVVVDSVVTDAYAGKKGGAIVLSGGENWSDSPGGILVLRNSTFEYSKAARETGGVIYCNEYSQVTIAGDDNQLVFNECFEDGGVVGATTNTRVVVEGGNFTGNSADESGGVFWTKGELTILEGLFVGNTASDGGGVFLANEESYVVIEGGIFRGENDAGDGGVGSIGKNSEVFLRGGIFTGNRADNGGGAFYADEDSTFVITGGNFSDNRADFGGFLYKEGSGIASCTGASIMDHTGIDGGAIYAVEDAVLDWECDLGMNSALVGPAIYAREDTEVILRGLTLYDNSVSRGSVVFLVSSTLRTYQVVFEDNSESPDLSAVQADDKSTYIAEDTSFVGFTGETVVFNEGTLVLDGCDFSESTATVLVYSGASDQTTVRNVVLGDQNYEGPAAAALDAKQIPSVDGIINVNQTCEGVPSDDDTESSSPPCSDGSLCLEGDMGVYCQCYIQESTGNETCISTNSDGLTLSVLSAPATTFFPDLLVGDLLLTLPADSSTTSMTSSAGAEEGIVWIVSVVDSTVGASMMNWTIFPSTGWLLPGHSINLRVVSLPSAEFDGPATFKFRADVMGLDTGEATPTQASSPSSSSTPSSPTETSISVAFYHCNEGNFWNISGVADDAAGACVSCADASVGDVEGLDCSEPGASTATLPLNEGYWRASIQVPYIRECFNQDACIGGSNVNAVEDYCSEGYEGAFCAVCKSGYGRGVSDGCHECTASFKGGMFFLIAVGSLAVLVVVVLLSMYLIGGIGAVSSTISTTKKSVAVVRRRSSALLSSSVSTVKNVGISASGSLEERRGASMYSTWPGDPISGDYGTSSDSRSLSGRIRGGSIALPRIRSLNIRAGSLSGSTHPSPWPHPKEGQRGGPDLSTASSRRVDAVRGLVLLSDQDDSDRPNRDKHVRRGKSEGGGVAWDQKSEGIHEAMFRGATAEKEDDDGIAAKLERVERRSRSDVGTVLKPRFARNDGVYNRETSSEMNTRRLSEKSSIQSRAAGSEVLETVDEGERGKAKRKFGWIWQNRVRRNSTAADGESQEGKASERGDGGKKATAAGTLQEEEKGEENTAAVKKIGGLRRKLPLSKLKIVVVVWQISAAFAEITQVPFPPAYEKFLTIIGIFTFDISWIFSASCIATGLNFYHTLLMVTIGPMVILALLGVTFYIGSRRSREPTSPVDREEQPLSSSQRKSSFFIRPSRTYGLSWISTHRRRQRVEEANRSTQEHPRSSFFEETDIPSDKHSPLPKSRFFKSHKPHIQGATSSPVAPAFGNTRRTSPVSKEKGSADDGQSLSRKSLGGLEVPGPGSHHNPTQDRLWGLFSRHTTIVLVILYLVYSSVSTVVFQTFACHSVPEVNMTYLRADFTIECNTPKHRAYRTYAIFMIILYPLGIPAAFLYFLLRQRSSINPPSPFDRNPEELRQADELHEKMELRQNNQSVAPTSFLWGAYFPDRYYYEVCECIRRLLLTGLLVFLVPYTTGQVAISCIFAFVSLLWFELLRPFVDPVDMQLYRTGCLVIFFSNFLALMIKSDVTDPNSARSTVYSVALISVHIMLFLSVFWNSWAAILAAMSNTNAQDAVLGFEIVDEEELGKALGKGKTKRADDQDNAGRKKTGARELEELEAPPAWERKQQVSTVDEMNAYQPTVPRPTTRL